VIALLNLFGRHQVKACLPYLVLIWIVSFVGWWKQASWDLILCLALVVLGLASCHVLQRASSRQRMEYVAQLPFTSRRAMLAPYSVATLLLLGAGALLHLHESTGAAYWEGIALHRVLSSVMRIGELDPSVAWHARPPYPLVHFLGFPVAAFWFGTLLVESLPRLLAAPGTVPGVGVRILGYAVAGLGLVVPPWLFVAGVLESDPALAAHVTPTLAGVGGVLLVLSLAIARGLRARIAANGVDGFPVEEDTWQS